MSEDPKKTDSADDLLQAMANDGSAVDKMEKGDSKAPNGKDGKKGKEGLTERIRLQTTQMKMHTPRQYKTLWILGAVTVLGLVGVAVVMVRDGGKSKTSRVKINPSLETSEDVDAKMKVFMGFLKDTVPKIMEQNDAFDKRLGAQEKRMADIMRANEEQRAADAKAIKEQMGQIQKMLDGVSGGKAAMAAQQTGDYDGFLQILIGQKTRSGLSLEEARIRIETWLSNNGYKGQYFNVMREKGLDKLGFLYVGDVAEPKLSDEELATIPEALRPIIKDLEQLNIQTALFQGQVLYREDDSVKWIKKRLNDDGAKKFTAQNLKDGAYMARVRKENVSKEMEEILPDLAAQRDGKGIAPTDLFRTEQFMFEQKKRWPTMSPGQHLSMTMTLAGMRANASMDLHAKTRAMKPSDKAIIISQAMDAVRLAQKQGITDQKSLIQRARNAIRAKSADLKVQLTSQEQEDIVLNVVADVLKAGNADPVLDAIEQAKIPNANAEREEVAKTIRKPSGLRLGPLELTPDKASEDAVVTGMIMCRRLKLDPTSSEGAAILAAILSSAPGIGKDAYAAVSERAMDLRAFTNSVITEFQEVMDRTRTANGQQVQVAGLAGSDANLVQAIEIGRVYGLNRTSEKPVADTAVKRRLGQLQREGLAIGMPREEVKGADRFFAVWQALGYQVPGFTAERMGEILDLIGKQLVERHIAHEQIMLSEQSKAFREKMIQELDSDLVVSLPVIVASRDDGKISQDLLGKLVVSGQNRFAAASVAEAILVSKGVNLVAERYATILDNDAMIKPLYDAIGTWIPDHVHEVLETGKPDINDSSIGPVAVDSAAVLKPNLEQFIVKTIITNNLEARIRTRSGTLNQTGYVKAMEFVRGRLASGNIEPLTYRRIDELTMELHQEAMNIVKNPDSAPDVRITSPSMAGVNNGQNAPTSRSGGPVNRPGFFEVKDEGLPGLPIGSKKEVVNNGQVFGIPTGSAMQVYLEIGQDVPIKKQGGGDQNRVQFRCRGGFFSPSGKWYVFPPTVLQGRVKPNAGGERNMVEITKMSVEVGHRHVEKEMTGIVTDVKDGIAGMRAKFDRHLEKIAPEALILAATTGLAEGLSATQDTTTVVVPGATTQATNTANSMQYGVGKGLEKGAEVLIKYEESYLEEMSPTLKTWNGQPLVAQFFSTVEFPEITVQEWAEAAQENGNWNGF